MRPRTAEQLRSDVGRRIAELRVAAGHTQAVVAERLGVSDQWLRHIEGGRANLTLASLARIARVLAVDAAELLRPPATRNPRRPGRPRRS